MNLFPSSPVVLFISALCVLCAHAIPLSPRPPSLSSSSSSSEQTTLLAVQFGENIAPIVSSFATSLLQNATNNAYVIQVYPNDVQLNSSTVKPGSVVFSFGLTPTRDLLIAQDELGALGSEGYIARSAQLDQILYFVGDGNAISPDVFNNNQNISNGAHYCLFRMLEVLGFAYFHPLRPTIPTSINVAVLSNPFVNMTEKPYWPVRGWHYHTEHLLELTDFFNGFGLNGTDDEVGWQSFIPYYQSFLFWLLANHQNRLEWLLLWAEDWADFANSTTRQQRQHVMTSMARAVGIGAGADIPIAEEQQHAWRMIVTFGDMASEIAQIHQRIDWLMAAGFDYISSENGYSEFTHPDDTSMVAWMNASVAYIEDTYNKKMYIKCHCSTGQIAKGYVDPWTGQPLNFNFLPIEADARLGVYPHTVQPYRFDDPAPTYGNTNFTYMFNFLTEVAGTREVVYHGETDYWVNYDIDVPIFYPLYADARLYDLRMIANFQETSNKQIQGQVNFDSGWEWGSWIQDVITARAAWNPLLNIPDQSAATAQALLPITSIFGSVGPSISAVLQRLIASQHSLMILGLVDGIAPENIVNFNGQAYLEGWDTWAEIGNLDAATATQPAKLSLLDVQDPLHIQMYFDQVEPLLAEMDREFGEIATLFESFASQVPSWTMDLYSDIVASTKVLSARATQVHALYDYAAGYLSNHTWRAERLVVAQLAMVNAQNAIANREANYRISPYVVAGWRPNPTCYSYGYLWTVKSMFYFWRDYEKAIDASLEAIFSPCYMNIINPVNVGFGEGILLNVTELAYQYFEKYHWTGFFDTCMVAPAVEPKYGPI